MEINNVSIRPKPYDKSMVIMSVTAGGKMYDLNVPRYELKFNNSIKRLREIAIEYMAKQHKNVEPCT